MEAQAWLHRDGAVRSVVDGEYMWWSRRGRRVWCGKGVVREEEVEEVMAQA